MTHRRIIAAASSLAVLALVLALAACGSSSSGSGASPGASAAASGPGVGMGGYQPVSNYMSFIGGHPGKADPSLSPIDIGVVNQQGGSGDIAPEWTNGAADAANYINNVAGGIDGHPVKMVECFIPDLVANAAQCGQQFANDASVQAVTVGAVAIGNQALESAVAPTGKVLVFGVSTSPVDSTYKEGYILYGDADHVEAPMATFVKNYLHAKSVALLYANVPGSDVNAEITTAALKFVGVPYKVAAYDATTTNLAAPFIASGAATAGVIINDAPNPQMCANTYKEIKQLNITTPVLTNVPCDNQITAQGDGGQLPQGWYYLTANPLPGDPADPSVAAFKKAADADNDDKNSTDAWTADSFGQFLTIAKWYDILLTQKKPLTAANLNQVAKTFKGAVPQGPPNLVCGTFKTAPAICNDKDSFFQNTAPGVFTAIARWIGPPAGFQIPKNLQ